MIHFSPGSFLLHAAYLQQHILTWTGLHRSLYRILWFNGRWSFSRTISNILCLNCRICRWKCFLSSDRNFMAPLAIVSSAALNSLQIGYIAEVSWFVEHANEVGFSPYIIHLIVFNRNESLIVKILSYLNMDILLHVCCINVLPSLYYLTLE